MRELCKCVLIISCAQLYSQPTVMNILFLTDNYPPETNAPATRTFEHARRWIENGHRVTVVTCAPNFPQGIVYPGYRNWPITVRWEDGIRVIRVWSYVTRNAGFFKRIMDYVSYALSASVIAPLLNFDVLVATSPQFFTTIAGCYVATIRRKPWVFELRDLWPESIKTVGAMNDGIVIRFLERLELLLYRQSDKVVSVTYAFKSNLVHRGIRGRKIQVIPNGVTTDAIEPCRNNHEPTVTTGVGKRPVVGYLGTHGLAHALDFIVRAASKRPYVDFVFVGDGAEKRHIARLAASVANVRLFDPVAKANVPRTLSTFDFGLVNLRDTPTFRTVIPSKIFEMAATALPILIGVEGESRELVERYGAGIAYEPENEESFLTALDSAVAMRNEAQYQQMQAGCRRLAEDYDRNRLADAMMKELEQLLA